MNRGASKWRKLKAMSASEIAARLKYRLFLAVERRRHRRGRLTVPAFPQGLVASYRRDPNWKLRWLSDRRGRWGAYFAGVRDRPGMLALFSGPYVAERSKALERADAALRREYSFFGKTFRFGDSIAWQADPESGRLWPDAYHADVPIHAGDIGCGDVKYVWELNRHQFLIDLGKAYFLESREELLHEIVRIVRSWREGNPYGTGVNWACALEPAFRVWSWLWTYHLVIAAGDLDDDSHLEWLSSFYEHGHFLRRHLEHHSSPFNHLVGEASALFALGLLFPEFDEAGVWSRVGREVLETRLRDQFYDDGGTHEQSTFYHHATLGFYLKAVLLADAAAQPLSQAVLDTIERAVAFSVALTQPDGRVPRIGGADDGKPIALEHLPFWDFRPYHATAAVLFDRSDFKFSAGRFWEDALWLLGPGALHRFETMAAQTPVASVALRESGYYVLRSGWTPDADYVCFDCGDQAWGLRSDDVPNAMHGHADCLSVVIWLQGRPVLVDPGFFCYNGPTAWEVYFRRSCAHSTATIDGRDQSLHVHKMSWAHAYGGHCEGWCADAHYAWAAGRHDGYARSRDGVVHRRLVWLRPGYVLLVDEFEGRGQHTIDLHFQFAPGRARIDRDGLVAFDDVAVLNWTATGLFRSHLRVGEQTPEGGWVAPSLGVLEPAPKLTLTGAFQAPRTRLLTVLAPSRASIETLAPADKRAGGLGLLVALPEGEDRIELQQEAGGAGCVISVERRMPCGDGARRMQVPLGTR